MQAREPLEIREFDPALRVHQGAEIAILAQIVHREIVFDLPQHAFVRRRNQDLVPAVLRDVRLRRHGAQLRRRLDARLPGDELPRARLHRFETLRRLGILGRALLRRDEARPLIRVGVQQHRRVAEVVGELIEALEPGVAGLQRAVLGVRDDTLAGPGLDRPQQRQDVLRGLEIHEREAAGPGAAAAREVQEGVAVLEAALSQELREQVVRARLRQVPHHHRGASVLPGAQILLLDLEESAVLGQDAPRAVGAALRPGRVEELRPPVLAPHVLRRHRERRPHLGGRGAGWVGAQRRHHLGLRLLRRPLGASHVSGPHLRHLRDLFLPTGLPPHIGIQLQILVGRNAQVLVGRHADVQRVARVWLLFDVGELAVLQKHADAVLELVTLARLGRGLPDPDDLVLFLFRVT
mmetsp:Transcript_22531/g.67589  ORF Transcript_22531/g.67589 Transcript_22531/m.67589 type:complete len:408 (+) Transcript_22531:327-1550(+)